LELVRNIKASFHLTEFVFSYTKNKWNDWQWQSSISIVEFPTLVGASVRKHVLECPTKSSSEYFTALYSSL